MEFMKNIKRILKHKKLGTVLVIAPIIFLGLLILRRAVNMVYWDEWELTSIFQHIHSGHIYWSDFWAQHNEHRLLFPTIILVFLAQLTHWNIVVECMVSLAVAVTSFYFLLRTFNATSKIPSERPIILVFLLSIVWFSPVQVENWLWGWQLEWFLSVFGVMLVAFSLSKVKNRVLSKWTLLMLLAGGVLAQYSLGNGTLVWPIALVALLYQRLRIKQVAVIAVTAITTTSLYYWGYTTPVGAPSRTLALEQKFNYIKFVLLYLGRPLAYLHQPALLAGFMLVVVFTVSSVCLFMRDQAKFKKAIPWIFLGLYSIASAMVTGLARLGFGVLESTSSRYTTISSLLLISTIILCWHAREEFEKLMPRAFRTVAALITPLVFIGVLSNAAWGVHSFGRQHAILQYTKDCTQQVSPPDACLLTTYPSAPLAKLRIDFLKSIHWVGY